MTSTMPEAAASANSPAEIPVIGSYVNGANAIPGAGAQSTITDPATGAVTTYVRDIPLPVPMAFHSFGGWKRSLFGNHAIYGPDGVHFYTQLKTAVTRWPDNSAATTTYSMPTHS
jgi:hypothetical protein